MRGPCGIGQAACVLGRCSSTRPPRYRSRLWNRARHGLSGLTAPAINWIDPPALAPSRWTVLDAVDAFCSGRRSRARRASDKQEQGGNAKEGA
jgi:hypothetical protein